MILEQLLETEIVPPSEAEFLRPCLLIVNREKKESLTFVQQAGRWRHHTVPWACVRW